MNEFDNIVPLKYNVILAHMSGLQAFKKLLIKGGVVLLSFVIIHLAINRMDICERNRYHTPLISNF